MSFSSKTALTTIIKATLIAGTLDIMIALLQYYIVTGKDPAIVLNYIASAIFGEEAYTRGNIMTIAGIAFHFIITSVWAALFYIIYPAINRIIKNIIVAGILYGIIIWVVMTQLIVPLSLIPKTSFNILKAIIAMVIVIAAVGLPISIIISKYYSKNKI